jgi:hypothetical protein
VIVAGLLAAGLLTPSPAVASRSSERETGTLATPQLIERAVRQGQLSRGKGDLYLAYAFGPGRVPDAYRSPTPWDGTLPLLHLRQRLARMQPGPQRAAINGVLQETAFGSCGGTSGGSNSFSSTYFYIEYNTIAGGLTIADYAASLDTTRSTEVNSFGWAAPPLHPSVPGNKYHVVVGALGSGLYGFVSTGGTYAGLAGDNPNTSWNDVDAYRTCMALNNNYDPFPGTSQQALDSTTAHEFNHSIQFGYGALTGSNSPDDSFVEGGATWMEDEVMDSADDNHNYLWPTFTQDMGQYTASPYPYWITFRGLTEPYGAGTPGGGEQVMQDFWELTSQSASSNMLTAINQALVNKGTTLADAYHAYAVAVKFNKACGGGYVYPHCFEEGPAYVANAGATAVQGSISAVGGSFSGSVRDNYALNWVQLPAGAGTYDVTLNNTSSGGQLRGSVVCDTGASLLVNPLPLVVGAGGSTSLAGFSSSGCLSAVAVITNQSQTAANPSGAGTLRSYQVTTAGGGGTTPAASVNDVSVTEGGTGTTTTATFTASLSTSSTETVTVNYNTSSPAKGGAAAGADYVATSGTVTFVPGDTSEPIPVTVNGDNADEPNEPFNVLLSGPANATIGDGTGVGTIIDDDPPGGGGCTKNCPPAGPALSISDALVTEPDAGTAEITFTVTLSPTSSGTVTVGYSTANGTKNGATAPSDYLAASGTLTFVPGDTSEPISVTVNGDLVPEPNETFTVILSGASGASIADGTGVGTILNDD